MLIAEYILPVPIYRLAGLKKEITAPSSKEYIWARTHFKLSTGSRKAPRTWSPSVSCIQRCGNQSWSTTSEKPFDDMKPFNKYMAHTLHTPFFIRQQCCLESRWTRWTLTMIIPWTTSLTMMYSSIYIWSGWFRRIQGVIPVWGICMILIRIQ